MKDKRRWGSAARRTALIGIMAGTIECVKLALSFLPNVEAVTLLTALYGYTFGVAGVAAAIVFVSIEPMIYGFGAWTVTYYLYWPFVAFVFMLLKRAGVKNRILFTCTAVLLTVWFGALSSLVDIGLFSGAFDNFWYRFGVYYARGAVFYAIQIVCNAVLFPLLFRLLADKLEKVKDIIL